MLILTLPLSVIAHYCSPASSLGVTITRLVFIYKATLFTFPNRIGFMQVRIQIKQPADTLAFVC